MKKLDELDMRLLAVLQQDSSLSQQALAERVHSSAPTVMRRLQALRKGGWIEREVAILNADKLAAEWGYGLQALVEITLAEQHAQALDAFERAACAHAGVQLCLRTSAGPDFVLLVQVADMPAYQALADGLFAQNQQVRNVKSFFVTKRAKFVPSVSLPVLR